MNFSEAESWMIDAAEEEVRSLCGDDGEFHWESAEKEGELPRVEVIHEEGGKESTYQVIKLAAITGEAALLPERYAVLMTHHSDDAKALYIGDGFCCYDL